MDSFAYFIFGLLLLVFAVIVAFFCINKKKPFTIPIVLSAAGFLLAMIGLFNLEHEEPQNSINTEYSVGNFDTSLSS